MRKPRLNAADAVALHEHRHYSRQFSKFAAASKLFLHHSLCDMPERLMAVSTALRSAAVRRTEMPGASALFLGTFGRPILGFIRSSTIKMPCFYACATILYVLHVVQEKDMAKNRPNKMKVSAMLRQRARPRLALDLTAPPGRGKTPRQFVMRHIAMADADRHRRPPQLNVVRWCRGETAKQFIKRHIENGNLGPQRHHRRLARVLERCGFVVKTVQRMDYHPIWHLSLRPGTVADVWDYKVVRRHVSTALSELGLKCPPREVGAVVTGQVLQVSFGWDVGKPGILTFWADGRNQGIRTCWLPTTAQDD